MSVKVRPFRGKQGKWEVDIAFDWPDGEYYREQLVAPGSSRSVAQRWGEQRERELLARGKPRPEEVKKQREVPTLRAFKQRYLDEFCKAERQKPSTIAYKKIALRAYLEPVVGDKRLDAIDNADVQRIKASMATQSPKSVNNVLVVLSTLLKKAAEWGVLDVMPCTIKLLKHHHGERPFLDFDELEALLDAARKLDRRAELVVLLGSNAGLRLGEILALRWSNVLLDRGVVRVAESEWNGEVSLPKGGRHRDVPMSARLMAALKAHRHLVGPRVLYGDEGAAVSAKVVRSWIRAAERRAGREVTGRIHILRHTFCSHLAILGAPAKAIQELAGHTELTTTMRYMHLSPSARATAVSLLDKQPQMAAARVEEARRSLQEFGDILETATVQRKTPDCSGVLVGWGTRIRT